MGKACGHGISARAFPGFFHIGSLVLALVFAAGLAAAASNFPRTVFIGGGTNTAHYYSSTIAVIGMSSTTGSVVYAGFGLDSATSFMVVREWGTVNPSGTFAATGLLFERVLRDGVSAGLGFSLVDAEVWPLTFNRLPVADVYGRIAIVKLQRSSVDLLVGLRTVHIWNFNETGVGPRLGITANGIL